MLSQESLKAVLGNYSQPLPTNYVYGTAGYRLPTQPVSITPLIFRLGLVACLRSCLLSRTVGVVITASHNPPSDNGAKLVDPMGEMLPLEWEKYASHICNCQDSELLEALTSVCVKVGIDTVRSVPRVVVGRDTRPSGIEFIQAIKDAVNCFTSGETLDFGVQTTPVVHYIVRCINTSPPYVNAIQDPSSSPQQSSPPEDVVEGRNSIISQTGSQDSQSSSQSYNSTDSSRIIPYGVPTVEGYVEKLTSAYTKLTQSKAPLPPLIIDCANGVGAHSLELFIPHLAASGLQIIAKNILVDSPELLNVKCGADFVKSSQSPPPSIKLDVGQRACSLDGDADRVVYYYRSTETETFRLLDGDKIASLAAVFFTQMLNAANIQTNIAQKQQQPPQPQIQKRDVLPEISIGVVQTAYANGNSTLFLQSRGLPVRCVPTGVKHLHHAASFYDIGIYFEANGHGTVLFSEKFLNLLRHTKPTTPSQKNALTQMLAMTELINQAVGDALSDMLLVEVILRHKSWGPAEWDALYTDFPNRLLKVSVPDRSAFSTSDAERKLDTPHGMQGQIDAIVAQYADGRSFVRPSGTEDCVRVYAEARDRKEADELAYRIAGLVYDSAGGDAAKRPAEFL